jgi:hypothetical protein
MVGTLCLLLAFAGADLHAQGEVVFSEWDWAVRSAAVIRRYAADTDSLVAARHRQAQDRLQQKQYVRVGEIVRRLSPNASGREVAAALQQMDSLRQALQRGADFAASGGQYRWTRLAEELQECADALTALPKDSLSQPIVSPLGVHLMKWTDGLAQAPLAENRRRLESWADRHTPQSYAFHTQLDSLCALYPAAEAELRALYERMLREVRGEQEADDVQPAAQLTKAEKRAAKQAEKARKKAEKERQKAEKARLKAEKRKNIVKKQ